MSIPVEEPMIRPCKGDCGRMTRSRDTRDRVVDDEMTGTIARVDSKYCSPCYRKFAPAAQVAKERDAARRNREKEQRLQAAFKASADFAAARNRRKIEARRREEGVAVARAHYGLSA